MSDSPVPLKHLADSLGVPAAALQELHVQRKDDAWHYPERNAAGEVVGTNRRYDDGSKRAVKDSRRGLCYAVGESFALDPDAGMSALDPVMLVEGMTDTAAGMSRGYKTIGRSTASPGGLEMAWLVELLAGRHVAIIAEHDESGAGMAGAAKVADALALRCATSGGSVKVVEPPAGVKDLRTWCVDHGCDTAELGAAIRGAKVWKITTPSKPERKAKSPKTSPRLIRMADVEPADIRWLWPGRIPLGRLTLLVGRPGDGKSFMTAYLAACVSCGRAWADGSRCPSGSIVLCSAEDDPADTIAPRLMAHDADRQRIHLLAGVQYRDDDDAKHERVFTLADLETLRQTLEQVDDCRLIVVDPIGSYLGGQADAHRDNEVRGVLAPACKLAAEYDAALVVVAHTRKSLAANADDMAMGSRAFTGLARSVLHLMADPDDESKCRRLLLPGKNNLTERPAGLAFDIGPGVVLDATGLGRPCVRWHEGEVDITADEAVNREPAGDDSKRTERDEAADWLRQALAAGPRPAKHIREEAKEVAGIAHRTLDRAKKEVGVDSFRPKQAGPWWWRLKSPDAQHHTPKGKNGGALAVWAGDSENGDSMAPSRPTMPQRHNANLLESRQPDSDEWDEEGEF